MLYGINTVSHSVAVRLLRCARNDTREIWFFERQRECHCEDRRDVAISALRKSDTELMPRGTQQKGNSLI